MFEMPLFLLFIFFFPAIVFKSSSHFYYHYRKTSAYVCPRFIVVVQWSARLAMNPRAKVRIPAGAVAAA